MDAQNSVSILTIVCLAIGFTGGLVSQLMKTTVDVDGTLRKRLTPAGRWALAISLAGLGGAIGSELLRMYARDADRERARRAAQEDRRWKQRSDDLATEIKRNTADALRLSDGNLRTMLDGFARQQAAALSTQLAITRAREAGAPLTSVTIRLRVPHVPQKIREQLQRRLSDEIVEDDEFGGNALQRAPLTDAETVRMRLAVMHQQAIQPFIVWLATGHFIEQRAVLAVSFGERFASVLPLGWVAGTGVMPMQGNVTPIPSGIRIGNEIQWHYPNEQPQRTYRRKRLAQPAALLAIDADAVVLTIEAASAELDDALLRYGKGGATTADLPKAIEIFAWCPLGHDLDDTPAPDANDPDMLELESEIQLPFQASGVTDDLERVAAAAERARPNDVTATPPLMSLQIVPNYVTSIAKRCDVAIGYDGELEPTDFRGWIRFWRGTSRE